MPTQGLSATAAHPKGQPYLEGNQPEACLPQLPPEPGAVVLPPSPERQVVPKRKPQCCASVSLTQELLAM